MKKILSVALLFAAITSCKKSVKPVNTDKLNADGSAENATSVIATPATYFDSLFTRYGGGWTGGDVAFSYKLPDGRSMWLWGDSFIDTVYPSRKRPIKPFIHNSITFTDDAGNFTTLHGGTPEAPKAYFDTTEPNQLWTNCAFMNSSQKKIFVLMVNIQATGEGGLFGFKVMGNSYGVLAYPDMSIKKVKQFNQSDVIDWSSCAFEDGDYVYIYGAESLENKKFMHVMRTSRQNPFNTLEYYNGSTWVTNARKSARVHSGISQQFTVFKYEGKYYLLSQQSLLFSKDIYLWDAASPVGPFTNKRKVYSTPQTGGNIITYNATAHTEFIQNGQLLVGYCTNSINGLDIFKNADNYRPYFVWISNWQ